MVTTGIEPTTCRTRMIGDVAAIEADAFNDRADCRDGLGLQELCAVFDVVERQGNVDSHGDSACPLR
jgi:hypothetical protein